MKYVRTNKRRKGGSKEAIIRQRIETAKAPKGVPWQKLPDGKKGNAVDQWAWEKFKESDYKTYPSEVERMVAVDNGTVGRFIEARGITSYEDRKIVLIGMNDKEVEINLPPEQNKPENGAEWRESQESLRRLMDEAQDKRDHLEAIRRIIAKEMPANTEMYQKMRAEIVRERKIEQCFENNEEN